MARLEGCGSIIARTTCVTALTVASQYLDQLRTACESDVRLLFEVFGVIIGLLECTPPVDLTLTSLLLLRRLIAQHPRAVFSGSDTRFASDLSQQCLRYCAAADADVRAEAAALWYMMAWLNMRREGDFNRVKLHSTIAMSVLAGSDAPFDRSALKSSLEAVLKHATSDAADKRSWALSTKSSS